MNWVTVRIASASLKATRETLYELGITSFLAYDVRVFSHPEKEKSQYLVQLEMAVCSSLLPDLIRIFHPESVTIAYIEQAFHIRSQQSLLPAAQ